MKLVINTCYGGFSLSPEAILWLFEHGYDSEGFKVPIEKYFGTKVSDSSVRGFKSKLESWHEYKSKPKTSKRSSLFVTVFTPDEKFVLNEGEIARDNPLLLKCIEELGKLANGSCANLSIVEIPDDVEWEISEYDGNESVEEKHRSWR